MAVHAVLVISRAVEPNGFSTRMYAHPAGLVFGALTSSLVSASLPSLLDLPDRSVAGLFHDLGTARRGGLKTTAKQSNKVGALRQVSRSTLPTYLQRTPPRAKWQQRTACHT